MELITKSKLVSRLHRKPSSQVLLPLAGGENAGKAIRRWPASGSPRGLESVTCGR